MNPDSLELNRIELEHGFDVDGFDVDGFDASGYDREGYNHYGYNSDGFNREGYDDEGYDAEGLNRDGFDRAGYNEDGYDIHGFDPNGYDVDGYDEDNYDAYGNHRYRDDDEDEDDDEASPVVHTGTYGYVGSYKHWRRPGAIGLIDGVTLGFELETVHASESGLKSGNEAIHCIVNSGNKDRILAERDGSLPTGGVEFVTGYCNWEAHKELLSKFCESLVTHEFESNRAAGVHIHVGVNPTLTNAVWYRIYWFCMYKGNGDLMRHIAGRYDTEFCYAGREWGTEPSTRYENSKYNCVNHRGTTIEFRCFESTTDFTRLSEYAEFVLAVVDYCVNGKFQESNYRVGLESGDFLHWLRNTRASTYPALVARCSSI